MAFTCMQHKNEKLRKNTQNYTVVTPGLTQKNIKQV